MYKNLLIFSLVILLPLLLSCGRGESTVGLNPQDVVVDNNNNGIPDDEENIATEGEGENASEGEGEGGDEEGYDPLLMEIPDDFELIKFGEEKDPVAVQVNHPLTVVSIDDPRHYEYYGDEESRTFDYHAYHADRKINIEKRNLDGIITGIHFQIKQYDPICMKVYYKYINPITQEIDADVQAVSVPSYVVESNGNIKFKHTFEQAEAFCGNPDNTFVDVTKLDEWKNTMEADNWVLTGMELGGDKIDNQADSISDEHEPPECTISYLELGYRQFSERHVGFEEWDFTDDGTDNSIGRYNISFNHAPLLFLPTSTAIVGIALPRNLNGPHEDSCIIESKLTWRQVGIDE